MRPLTFITGVIFGSAAALGLVLGLVLFFRWDMTLDTSLDQTVVQTDLPVATLVLDMLIFLGLAVLSGLALWGDLRRKAWRGRAVYLMAVALTGVCIFFLADAALRLRELAYLAVLAACLALSYALARRLGLVRIMQGWLDS
jgi:hypothetical protein